MSILTPDEIQECMTAARKVMEEGRDLEGCFAAEIETALLKKLSTSKIKTYKDWLDEFPDGQIITNSDVREAMLKEIDDLRVALAYAEQEHDLLFAECQSAVIGYSGTIEALQAKLKSKTRSSDVYRKQRNDLRVKLQELNLQYISDFGQLQEKVEGLFSEYDMENSSFALDARCIFERTNT